MAEGSEKPGALSELLYVVIADDDIDDHLIIKDATKACNRNHVVTSVYNGQQLLDLLLRQGFYTNESPKLPDVVIIDVRMPLMDGLTALEKIKGYDFLKDVPIFVLTEISQPKDRERALKLGAIDYFDKPLKYHEVVELMMKICGRVISGKSH